ncbi:MAG: tetratricopeptide repeat protein [Gammaproteobacteria bacterium]
MPASIAKELAALLIGLVLTGCGDHQPSSHSEERSLPGQQSTGSQFQAAPCAMALAPLASADPGGREDRAEREVALYQQAVRRATRPVPHLERLGWTFVELARIHSDPGFYKLAEQVAHCIDSKRPNSSEGLLLRGHVLHNLHRFKEAEVMARKLVAQRGTWFDHGLLGDVLMEQGKLDEAIDAYQLMMDVRPGPQAYSRAAHMRWLRGDLAGAIEMMRKTVQASGSGRSESAVWARVRLALYRMQAGDLEAADRLVEGTLVLQPDYAPALLARGRILLAQGQCDAALPDLTRATDLNPLPEYQWTLIEALRAAGRDEDAEELEAQLRARGSIEDGRTYALYLATIGRDLDTARRLAIQELNVREDVFTLDTVAWALHASGRHQQAFALSRRALAEGTEDARLFYHAGAITARAGDTEQAYRWLAQAMALQQMLLPSERVALAKEFAALASQMPSPAAAHPVRRDPLTQ